MKDKEPSYKKHLVNCPHCGKEILDHMDKCPFCEGEIKGTYREINPKTLKKIKIVLWAVLGAVAVTLIVLKATGVI
ncbi:MAG: hypothetical protein GX959_04580 [Clostridiales bacterium]|jgi:uncharacterized membrane protein YvbJ|nr:hypothetical protein [Clostridiales bacterium]